MTICPIFAMPGTERAILTKVRTCRRSVRGRVDKVVLKTFQREVEQQCRFALIAAEDMRQALQEWEGLSDEMDHTSSVGTLDHLEAIKATELQSPAEIHLVKEALLAELQKREEAGRVLASLRLAIEELEGLLDEKERN